MGLKQEGITDTLCRFSGGRFYHEAGMTKAREAREKKLGQHPSPDFEEFVTTLPSTKVPTVEALVEYIKAVTRRLPELMAHYGSLSHRNWRMKVPFSQNHFISFT